jgi:hypothetical protein
MTEVKHFDDVFVFLNSIINKNGAKLQFSNAGPFSDRAHHAGEPAKQIHVVEQTAAKTPGCLAIVLGNVPDDFSEVA